MGGHIPHGTITFDKKPVDNTNSFDETTGHFKAPIDGTYVFFVNTNADTIAGICVYVNDVIEKYFYDGEDFSGDLRQLNFFFEVVLHKEDQTWLFNDIENTIHVDYYHSITFLGYLM